MGLAVVDGGGRVSAWTLHLGDCLDPVAGLASLPDKSVDHVICDPPYEAEAHTAARRVKSGDGRSLLGASLDFSRMDETTRAAAAAQVARLARRWVIVFCQAEAVPLWRDALEEASATYRRPMVWVKRDGLPNLAGDRPSMGYESIVLAHAPGKSRWNGGGKIGVYDFLRNHNGGEPFEHPTQKPLGLMEALVSDFTDPGETILDPFAGSGTTGVAAIRNGRRFIGWEKDPKYHEIARKRLEGTKEQLVLGGPRVKAKQENLL
jgi:site-specific DNA-methyltransferase (adenine-specific)